MPKLILPGQIDVYIYNIDNNLVEAISKQKILILSLSKINLNLIKFASMQKMDFVEI